MSVPAKVMRDRHYTYEDYLKFPDDERWEIIDGVAYNMSPAPSTEHQNSGGELYRQVANQLLGKPCKVFIAPVDVRFQRSNQTDKIVQPDLLVVCDRGKIDRSGIIGAPDWIVEVLSPGTAGKDQIIKHRLYEKEGVREYWLVHPVDRILSIHLLGADDAYGRPEVQELRGKTAVQAVPGLEIDWDLWEPLDFVAGSSEG